MYFLTKIYKKLQKKLKVVACFFMGVYIFFDVICILFLFVVTDIQTPTFYR